MTEHRSYQAKKNWWVHFGWLSLLVIAVLLFALLSVRRGAGLRFARNEKELVVYCAAGMIAGYQEVADYAATKGIGVGLQNHPSTGDEMLKIRSETGRENFNFIMDTGQWVGSPGSAPRGETDPDIDFYGFMEQTVPHAMYVRTKFYKIESGKDATGSPASCSTC